jgi:hypothetical protein
VDRPTHGGPPNVVSSAQSGLKSRYRELARYTLSIDRAANLERPIVRSPEPPGPVAFPATEPSSYLLHGFIPESRQDFAQNVCSRLEAASPGANFSSPSRQPGAIGRCLYRRRDTTTRQATRWWISESAALRLRGLCGLGLSKCLTKPHTAQGKTGAQSRGLESCPALSRTLGDPSIVIALRRAEPQMIIWGLQICSARTTYFFMDLPTHTSTFSDLPIPAAGPPIAIYE